MNTHIQNCSTWLINLHSRQNGGDDCVNRRTCVRYFWQTLGILMSFEGNTPGCVHTVYSGMKLKSAANSSVIAGFLTA